MMRILEVLQARLAIALAQFPLDVQSYASQIRPTNNAKFGDYQANCAMPLKAVLNEPPHQIAERIVAALQVRDLCEPPEIAGPGFINLRLRDDWICEATLAMLNDDRLGVPDPPNSRTILIDFSSPNVAKPMHVGHIRSTVIGDALANVFRFLGHRVITDNHLGDWGTQFGMIIYGYKHFVDEAAFSQSPVQELVRLYRLVNSLVDYHAAIAALPDAQETADQAAVAAEQAERAARDAEVAQPERRKRKQAAQTAKRKSLAARETLEGLQQKIAQIDIDPAMQTLAASHSKIAGDVLRETAKLHEGDRENLGLWQKFLPHCSDEINRIYDRLNVRFDHTLGESFYQPMLGDVVQRLVDEGLATESEGAICVFLEGFDAPLIVRKKDGAFLYATTDLATLLYRNEHFRPDEILYVVDSRQSDHFDKLFALAPQVGLGHLRLVHVQFGTVLGPDGKPLKTRSGNNANLETLLDDAVTAAMEAVCEPERSAKLQPPLTDAERQQIANVIGHGAIKYADLSHHRTSDYRFSLKKMVALEGNTVAYLEYAYARIQGIFRAGETTEAEIAANATRLEINHDAERELAISLLRFSEALQQMAEDYAPNALVDYLYDTARRYMVFNDNCSILKAPDSATKDSRLALAAVTAKVLRAGLRILGIEVVPRM